MRTILAAIALIASAMPADAAQVPAQTLLENCTHTENIGRNLACAAYIAAVADLLERHAIAGHRVCIPPDTEIQKLEAVVVSYLRAQPRLEGMPTDLLVVQALEKGFPCPR